MRMVVPWITERYMWGMLQPEEHCTKTGDRAMEVLRTKHPDAAPLYAATMDKYTGQPPELIPVDRTEETIT